jgi:DNA-binding GntR family transcriptional regulator
MTVSVRRSKPADLESDVPASASSHRTGASRAYQEIKQRILDNTYMVGSSVSIQLLEDLLNISRTPIRDALIRLEKERLVELVPHHGFRVLPIAVSEMHEIYQILSTLEVLAVELLMQRQISPEELDELDASVSALEQALQSDDRSAWARSDELFHAKLIALSGNSRLVEIVRQFREQTQRVREITLRLRSEPVASTKAHRDLISAIRDGDVARACSLHQAQRLRSRGELEDVLGTLNIRHL